MNVDNKDLGKFKSSGIIIATGTGSTGWLYGARQTKAFDVKHLKKVIALKSDDLQL